MSTIRNIFAAVCLGLCATCAAADDMQDFIDALNHAWVSNDLAAVRYTIDGRLHTSTNDIAALAAKMDVLASFDGDITNAQTVAQQMTNAMANSDWSDDEEVHVILMGMIEAVLSPAAAQDAGYLVGASSNDVQLIRQAYPSIYPITRLLRRIYDAQD